MFSLSFYAQKQLLLSARLSHRSSVRPFATRVNQSKAVQARITKFLPSAARKTLVTGTVKLFHKFEGGHFEQKQQMRGGGHNLRFLANKLLYLNNSAR